MSLEDDRTHFLSLATDDDGPSTLRTQHGLTRTEVPGGAEPGVHHTVNKRDLPDPLLITLEAIINFAMITEVAIRVLALGQNYWTSIWNLIDLMLVLLCCITLVVISPGCSAGEREEAILDTVLLVVRNVVQFFRLAGMLRRNRHQLSTRAGQIDFANVASASHRDLRGASIDFGAFDPHMDRDEQGILGDSDDEFV
ncbi:hypothetical protein BC936DRAFT_141495 [Jimgerdemannia flammicorona]|uniref:Ion transport domain-containing protein n=1 Tax=Jimgerdemannia flammicorona TaxID=994334 RepID=A0A433A247_9FUNG|nr:hypothetical protein BC936DRAFT_141495 [Jimgerdemannia flammicorona]